MSRTNLFKFNLPAKDLHFPSGKAGLGMVKSKKDTYANEFYKRIGFKTRFTGVRYVKERKMKLRARKADLKKDGSLLFELYNKCFNRSFDFRSFTVKEQMEYLKDFVVWIYYDDEKPIGFLTYKLESNNKAELDTMAVLPEYQKKGVGKRMMRRLSKAVKDKKVCLVTHPKNTAAVVLYLKHGFQICEWKDNYYGDGEPRLLLEKKG